MAEATLPDNRVIEVTPTEPTLPETIVEEKIVTPLPPVTPPVQGIPYEQYHAKLDRIKELEAELEEKSQLLNSSPPEIVSGDFSDEGRILKGEIDSLKDQLALKDLHVQFPGLKNLSSEFETYRAEFPRHKLENVAKLFLTEKGLVTQPEPRKGLEKPVGGTQTTPSAGTSGEDIKRLRETNPRQYEKLVLSGQLNPDEIK